MSGYVLIRQLENDISPTDPPPRPEILYIYHTLDAANKAFDGFVARNFTSQGMQVEEMYWNVHQSLQQVSVSSELLDGSFSIGDGELWIDTAQIRDACVEANLERNRV
jgi:hypothetical protein